MIPKKIEVCCAINSEANATPKMIPKYLFRSPVSIFKAVQFMITKLRMLAAGPGAGLYLSWRKIQAGVDRLREGFWRIPRTASEWRVVSGGHQGLASNELHARLPLAHLADDIGAHPHIFELL